MEHTVLVSALAQVGVDSREAMYLANPRVNRSHLFPVMRLSFLSGEDSHNWNIGSPGNTASKFDQSIFVETWASRARLQDVKLYPWHLLHTILADASQIAKTVLLNVPIGPGSDPGRVLHLLQQDLQTSDPKLYETLKSVFCDEITIERDTENPKEGWDPSILPLDDVGASRYCCKTL